MLTCRREVYGGNAAVPAARSMTRKTDCGLSSIWKTSITFGCRSSVSTRHLCERCRSDTQVWLSVRHTSMAYFKFKSRAVHAISSGEGAKDGARCWMALLGSGRTALPTPLGMPRGVGGCGVLVSHAVQSRCTARLGHQLDCPRARDE